MKQLIVLSGKGGTGKTTVTAALAHLASQDRSVVLADADVDAANLELVLDPTRLEEHDFRAGKLAVIDPEVCTACGICESVCRFDAIVAPLGRGDAGVYKVDPLACEGCAACFYQCPEDAIQMEEQRAGLWFRSDTRFGPLFHAHLFAGQENSGKLVASVKEQARLQALESEADLLLVDGPPGIGCPVIASISGADLTLLVIEPTVSGAHDLERIIGMAEHFSVPSMVAINKEDLNTTQSDDIAAFCAQRGIKVVGRIPYDTAVTEAMVQGSPITAYNGGAVADALEETWQRVRRLLFTD